MMLDLLLARTAQYSVALLMLAGGIHKVLGTSRFVAVIDSYRVVPTYFVRPVALLLTVIELGIGIALVVPDTSEMAALAAATLLAGYVGIMALPMLGGRRPMDCGCSLFGKPTRLSWGSLIRGGSVALLAAAGSLPHAQRELGWGDVTQMTAAVCCLILIYVTVDAILLTDGSKA